MPRRLICWMSDKWTPDTKWW